MNEYKSAEIVKDNLDRQYHLGINSKEISDKIILVGDPERAKKISLLFDKINYSAQNREFISYTGIYKGFELSVLSTGIGAANTEIAIIELCQLKFPITIIRCGTCGALQDDIEIGDLVITTGAVRMENTSTFFVETGYPAVASHEVNLALLKSASQNNSNYHYGITATAPGFYGAQGRHVDGFPLKEEDLINRLKKQGVKNIEMECSALLTLASFRGFRAGCICAVFANRTRNKFILPDKRNEAEQVVINTTLGAFEVLNKMDKQKGNSKFWFPEN